MQDQFIYPILLTYGTSTTGTTYNAEFKDGVGGGNVLPPSFARIPMVNTNGKGTQTQGLYYWGGKRWTFILPYEVVCTSIINASALEVKSDLVGAFNFANANANVALYRNGIPQTVLAVTDSRQTDIWTVVTTIPPGGTGSGDVKSVNNTLPDGTGNVTINTGVLSVEDGHATTGDALFISGTPDANGILYFRTIQGSATSTVTVDGTGENLILSTPLATTTSPGVVQVGNNLTVDSNGVLSGAAPYTLPVATTTVLGGVKQGTGVTIAGDGTLSVTPYTLPVATTTVLGGVKQGTGVTIAGDGTLSANVISVSGQTGAVVVQATNNNAATGTTLITDSGATTGNIKLKTVVAGTNIALATDVNGNLVINNTLSGSGITQVASVGTGTSVVLADGTSGGIAQIKSLAAGSNITITSDAQNQTLTITANQVITPATTTTIGGVIVGAGLNVIANGTISLAAPTGANLGGVKQGTGISIAADGTISVTAVGGVTSVSGQTGAVVVSAVDTSTASGTSLITASGATTGTINIRRLVAGTGITLAADGNNNLTISSSGGYTLPAATTTTLGGIIVGTGLSVTAGGTLSVTSPGGVTSITAGTSGALTGAITFTAGQSISLSNTGNSIQINGTGVPEAPNDGNQYGRQNLGWTLIPDVGSAITSLTSDTTAGSVSILETQPNVNTAITKSLTAGTNVTFTDNGSNIVIAASIPAGTVSTVNSVSPNSSGNVTLTAANVNALPVAGGTMSGTLNMGSQTLTGLITPVNPSDAVPLSYIQALSIDNGTF